MKKIARILLSATTALSLLVVPVVVQAQDADPIVVDDPFVTDQLPATGATPEPVTPTTPDSGIAPPAELAKSAAVFVGGSALGAGLGFGLVSMRKKQLQK